MTATESAEPELILGPMLRYVSETEATIWVETDRECQVEVLGRAVSTFEVAGHHYGLVVIDGLAPGSEHKYQVALDGIARWPLPDSGFPPSVLRTLSPDRPVRLAFGSCRLTEVAPSAAGIDALAACARSLRSEPRDRWPDVLLMIGDQVYADDPGPATRRFMASHRALQSTDTAQAADTAQPTNTAQPADSAQSAPVTPPGEIADFAEYCALYREGWSDPAARWLFSVVPTAMIFDDHDVHDDWNTSAAWRRTASAKPWWGRRMVSAYQSYWVYQHLGNLSPQELANDETWAKVRQSGDAAPVLADLARRADQRSPDVRWSFARTFPGPGGAAGGQVRVVVLDSRSRRVVNGQTRLMADEREWRWLTESVSGDWQHVVIATSVPPLLPRGIHMLEAWTERVAGGAWGRWATGFAERLRRDFDLEHWPAFGASFAKLEQLLTDLAAGRLSPQGNPPGSVTIISGDIHHSYLAAVELPLPADGSGPPDGAQTGHAADGSATAETGGPKRTSAVYEAVCSPFHQAMAPKLRYAQRLASTKPSGLTAAAAAMLAGAYRPTIKWRITDGPWFVNMIATLTYDGPKAIIRFDQPAPTATAPPPLATLLELDLT